MSTPTISAVLNTRNEERNIRSCLETLKWCDEIVIVDMESEDGTLEIARQYTNKIYRHPVVLAFDTARRFAVEKAAGEWILLIDADELVPRYLSDTLRAITRRNDIDAIFIPYQNYLFGAWNRNSGWWPNYHCRFFKKTSMEFSKEIHNFLHLKTSARRESLPAESRLAIHHFAYRDISQFVDKMNRYTTIEAALLDERDVQSSWFRMFLDALRESSTRFIRFRGYKDGVSGIFTALLMAMYRMLAHMKLRELRQGPPGDVAGKYDQLKQDLIREHETAKI